jgi:hypothetical protein
MASSPLLFAAEFVVELVLFCAIAGDAATATAASTEELVSIDLRLLYEMFLL